MDVFWLQQNQLEVPVNDGWLSDSEAIYAGRLRIPKRRLEWRLGRWTAKRTVASYLGIERDNDALAQIELRPEPLGAPQVFVGGRAVDAVLSLSHSNGYALSVIAARSIALGCDLEMVEQRSDGFVDTFFSPAEVEWLNAVSDLDRARNVTLVWAAKESVLKAMRVGLRLDTRHLNVIAPKSTTEGDWWPLVIELRGEALFHGWWCDCGSHICTVATDRILRAPSQL